MSKTNDSDSIIDYSQPNPRVTIDGVTYTLHDGGALSLATPHILSKLYKRLKVDVTHCDRCNFHE